MVQGRRATKHKRPAGASLVLPAAFSTCTPIASTLPATPGASRMQRCPCCLLFCNLMYPYLSFAPPPGAPAGRGGIHAARGADRGAARAGRRRRQVALSRRRPAGPAGRLLQAIPARQQRPILRCRGVPQLPAGVVAVPVAVATGQQPGLTIRTQFARTEAVGCGRPALHDCAPASLVYGMSRSRPVGSGCKNGWCAYMAIERTCPFTLLLEPLIGQAGSGTEGWCRSHAWQEKMLW